MAPTLYGRHKDVTCEKCGYSFAVGASDEVDELEYLITRINTALCPNCRYENAVRELPVFKGDRILVTKFTYEFSRPRRWDVAVFKYPEEPKTNYIKRIVGLPGESH
ncbi:MAG: signal peptidase I [Planctomycetes bacterium]|nr:signal peptidase I [Planctomycetota bacterium]